MAEPSLTAHRRIASAALAIALRERLCRYPPFAQMAVEQVDEFIAHSTELYFAPNETVLSPDDGVIDSLLMIREGAVSRCTEKSGPYGGRFEYEAGDLFPVAALLARRAVTAPYVATRDTFCLSVPFVVVQRLAESCPPFSDLLNRRMQAFLQLSRKALQAAYASQNLASQSLERPLREIGTSRITRCGPDTPIGEAMRTMQEQRIGSIVVTGEQGGAIGILTRHDILSRIALPQLPLETPISAVMSAPVHTLPEQSPAQRAALLMARHGLRHVPYTRAGLVVGIVSERDLFAIQRRSIRDLAASIDAAPDVETLEGLSEEIRGFAAQLIAQGVQAAPLTELISQLNDRLTSRLVSLIAALHGRKPSQMCWLAFGSEGRSEQTVATDQDNGLIFVSDEPERERPQWLAFARAVNDALARCGFPLCKGNVMASNPECCLTMQEWQHRFSHWIDQGTPDHLLAASIYFDLRALTGREDLVLPLRALIVRKAAASPRFCKLLATEVLRTPPPLDWLGRIQTERIGDSDCFDLKRLGTGVLVAVARIRALEYGIDEVGTLRRLAAVAHRRQMPPQRSDAWRTAFEFLQMLRLRTQLPDSPFTIEGSGNPNLIAVERLNDIDRRVLKEALRVVMNQQKELELDYETR